MDRSKLDLCRGLPITVNFYHTPYQRDDWWTHHFVEILVGLQKAGYMVISQIEPNKIKGSLREQIISYLYNQRGYLNLNPEYPNQESLLKNYLGLPINSSSRKIDRSLRKLYEKDYRSFCYFHVGKPWVSMVRLYGQKDTKERDPWGKTNIDRSTPLQSFQNIGLSKVLYQQAAFWMAEQELFLWADSNQTQAAQKVWVGLQKSFPQAVSSDCYHPEKPELHSSRLFLDGSKMDEVWIPDWSTKLGTNLIVDHNQALIPVPRGMC